MKRVKFTALALIFALMFSMVSVPFARADLTDLDKDDDGDIDLLDAAAELLELGLDIYEWWSEPSTSAPDSKEEPKREESSSSWWWPF